MHYSTRNPRRSGYLGLAILGAALLLTALLLVLDGGALEVRADPIDPPTGYPKFILSVKSVTPTLAHTGGVTLYYTIEIVNTGAYTGAGTTLIDFLPDGTTFNDDFQSSVPSDTCTVTNGVLTWVGDVGFDSTAVLSFSVSVEPTLSGTVRNTAIITHPLIARPFTMTADTVVTDVPLLTIEKTSLPAKPGTNRPMTYTIVVANWGQPAANLPITVTDWVPLNTTVHSAGGGTHDGTVISWTRHVTLDLGQTTTFTFSVDVDEQVPSGTVISNAEYWVSSPEQVTAGEPYTVTIIDPILMLTKDVWPDPPGSNREMTYTLTVLNVGSLATGLVITDRVPAGVTYERGGTRVGDIVSWTLDSLDTGESAEFTFTMSISDVMDVAVVNADYTVCSVEGVCQPGDVLTRVVQGPIFEVEAILDPIAHKPGGGQGTYVTPTLVIHNVGAGNALDAVAILCFDHLSVQFSDLVLDPIIGTLLDEGPECGEHCRSYTWIGDLAHGQSITFSTDTGQSTIVGEEGTVYSATAVITDVLGGMVTEPVTGTAYGLVTHFANLVPSKSAPEVVGPGQLLTYNIQVFNRGLSAQDPPILTDVIPFSTTFVWASDGGVTRSISNTLFVSWTLPTLSTGEDTARSFTVRVDEDLISGTQIVNREYSVFGYGNVLTDAVTSGPPVTTTVQEVGLIHSFKEVTPTIALPGSDVVLTYYLHIVNSSALPLTDVLVYDLLPWQYGTYRRDAVASAGDVTSDVVGIHWSGNVGALSSEIVTFTVLVDPDFQGAITNTATISHADLRAEVVVDAVAYITDQPVLRISKSAWPDPVERGEDLEYTIRVVNLGQPATHIVITDRLPANATYVPGSATSNGQLVNDGVLWTVLALAPGQTRELAFHVTAGSGSEIVNDLYAATCEGVTIYGPPLVTRIQSGNIVYLPLVLRGAP
jgi:uncharacterized repeat protein (TIGR01451 family)